MQHRIVARLVAVWAANLAFPAGMTAIALGGVNEMEGFSVRLAVAIATGALWVYGVRDAWRRARRLRSAAARKDAPEEQ